MNSEWRITDNNKTKMTHNKKESKCCDRWEIPEAPECGPLLPEEGMKKKKYRNPENMFTLYTDIPPWWLINQ